MTSPGQISCQQVSTPTSLFRFILVGALVLLIENLLVWLLLNVWDQYVAVRSIATVIAIVLSYLLNTRFSFSSSHSIKRFVSYVSGVSISIAVSYVVSLGTYYLLFEETRPLLSVNIGAGVAALTNFVFQNSITYARKG